MGPKPQSLQKEFADPATGKNTKDSVAYYVVYSPSTMRAAFFDPRVAE